jgi:ABC-type transporter MlaC component
MRKHHSALGGVALALALTLTGCAGDDTEPRVQDTPSQSPSPTPTSTPTPKTPEEKAAAQLTKYLDVRDDFYRAATIDFKRLNEVATGDEFLQVQAAVADIDQYDIKVTGKYVHTLAAPRNRGAEIRIIDCEDRTGVTERSKDGKDITRNDPNGNPLRNPVPVEYTVVRDKGAWKVSNSDVKWDQSC